MKLIVLGSGTCVPSLSRSAPGYFLAAGDKQLLVDIGSTVPLQLVKAGGNCFEIDAVFVTHTHPDHISGLSPFLHALTSTPGKTRVKELYLIGPPVIKEYYNRCICSIQGPPKTFPVTVVEMKKAFELGPFHILGTKTVHTANSMAFRFFRNNRSVVFTGDCDFDRRLVSFSRTADLLVIDCSFPNNMKTKGHLTPKECALIAKEAGVKKMLLTHIYPSPAPENLRLEECREIFAGEVVLARDLMEIDI